MTEEQARELNDKLAEARDLARRLNEEYEADGDWREDDYWEGLDEDLYL